MNEQRSSSRTLADRVAALERSNRRLKAAVSSMVAAGIALSTLAVSGSTTIQAKAIHLLDENGKPRLLLSVRTGLAMLDAKNRPRIVLGIDGEGPGLSLYGENSQVGMIANVNHDGPALAMRDAAGRTRALLAAIDQGPGLILWNDDGKEGAALVSRGKGGSLTLADNQGRTNWHAP